MRAFLTLSLLALVACGGESKALFEQQSQGQAGTASPGSGGSVATGAQSSSAGSSTSPPEGGAGDGGTSATMAGASAVGGVEQTAGTAAGGTEQGGSAGESSAGKDSGGSSSGAGGKAGSSSGGSAGQDNGEAGKSNEPTIPEACAKAGACQTTGSLAGKGYCEISDVWPAGACVQCPLHYLDCDGPEPEIYGEPGAGCETFDTNMGKCPK
jgi:hypothetical protein